MGIRENIYESMDVGIPAKKYIDTGIVTSKMLPALDKNIMGLSVFYGIVGNRRYKKSTEKNVRLSDSAITLRNKIMGAFE